MSAVVDSHLILRFRCLRLRGTLDRALASGLDPAASSELSMRARQLRSIKCRERLAAILESVVGEAVGRRSRSSMHVPVRLREVRDSSGALVDLATRLRDHAPVAVRGVAMAHLLVHDGASPLYWDRAPLPLEECARSTLSALAPEQQAESVPAYDPDAFLGLLDRGCPAELAMRILAPIAGEDGR